MKLLDQPHIIKLYQVTASRCTSLTLTPWLPLDTLTGCACMARSDWLLFDWLATWHSFCTAHVGSVVQVASPLPEAFLPDIIHTNQVVAATRFLLDLFLNLFHDPIERWKLFDRVLAVC